MSKSEKINRFKIGNVKAWNPDSSVGMLTSYGLDGTGFTSCQRINLYHL